VNDLKQDGDAAVPRRGTKRCQGGIRHSAGECNNHNTDGTEAKAGPKRNASTNCVSMTRSPSPSPMPPNIIRTLMLSENRTVLV